MLKGCLIAAVVACALAFGGAVFVWTQRDAIVTGVKDAFKVPPHGTREHIEPLYGDLFKRFDAAADSADSKFSFGAAVEKMELPDEVVYLGIDHGNETTDVIKRKSWNGHGHTVINGYGAGHLNVNNQRIEIMIRNRQGSWNYMDGYVVYLEFKEEDSMESPAAATNAVSQGGGDDN